MKIVTSALVVLGLLGAPAARGAEVPFVYCPATGLSGSASFTPAVSTASLNHDYVITVNATCVGGAEAGFYSLRLEGAATGEQIFTGEDCSQGHSVAAKVTGNGPQNRPVSGTFSFDRLGVHYVINGTVTMGGTSYHLLFWLDVAALASCATTSTDGVSGGPVTGHGAIVRTAVGDGCSLIYGREQTTAVGGVSGGPWVAPGALSVKVVCTISVGDPIRDAGDAQFERTTPGPVGALAETVTFDPGPGLVWVCTDITWQYATGPSGSYQPDCQPATVVLG